MLGVTGRPDPVPPRRQEVFPAMMTTRLIKLSFVYPVQLLVLFTALALILRFRVKTWWAWTLTGLGLAALVVRGCMEGPDGTDLRWFWLTGRDVLDGIDPYHYDFCVWPPTSFALFSLFARFPFPELLFVWTVLNILALTVLVVVAERTLRAAGGPDDWQVSRPTLGILTAALLLSVSSGYGLGVAQVSLFVTLALLLALWARYRGWPVLAPVALAFASIKAATLLPFLLLFRRRKDLATWLLLPVACLGLYLLANPALELFTRLRECLHNIAVLSTPGHMNNFAHPVNADMISFDRAIYFLGVDDRGVVRLAQIVVVVLLGAWVVWQLRGRHPLPEAAACSLVAFYAALFLYHRLYDMSILVLPLVYTVGRAQVTNGRQRFFYVASAFAVLGVHYLRLETVKALGMQPRSPELLLQLVKAAIVPHGVWLTIAGMVSLAAAERCRPRQVAVQQPLGQAA